MIIELIDDCVVHKLSLVQNYTNLFNPSTTIKFDLPIDSKVVMEIYNILGEKVMTLINQEIKPDIMKLNLMQTILPAKFLFTDFKLVNLCRHVNYY